MSKMNPTNIKQRSFRFAVDVVKLLDRFPRTLAATEIGRQLIRSGTSVGANLQEADGAESHRDFVHKIGIARKEAQETRYWLQLVNETILPNDEETRRLTQEADELARILYAIAHPQQNK